MHIFLWISVVTVMCVFAGVLLLDFENVIHRRMILSAVALSLISYMGWRLGNTVLWGKGSFSAVYTQVIFFIEIIWIFEVVQSLHFYVYSTIKFEDNLNIRLRQKSIDVIIPSFNESYEIINRTLMAASNIVWPGEVRIYLLDDGKREWLPSLCKLWGGTYISRPDNESAKAGNINHALTYLYGDFTLVLDADFLVSPTAIETLIAPMDDPKVAVVQAPQEFYNPDPIQRSLEIFDLSPNDQRHFFNGILHARSNGDAAFFCGSCGLLRNSAIKELGGFPTESITEDIFLSIKLKQLGYKSISIREPVALGLSPDTINDLIKQRSRWGEGALQMNSKLWKIDQSKASLKLIDRFKFLPMYWAISFPVRFLSLIVPQLYFLFGWSALANSTLSDLLMAQGSIIAVLVCFNFWGAKKRLQPFVTSIWQDLLSLRLAPKFMLKLLLPYQVAKFEVTPKGKNAIRSQESRLFNWFVDFLLFLTILALFLAIKNTNNSGISIVSLFWTLVNLIRLLFVRTALRNEKGIQSSEMQVTGVYFDKLWIERGLNLQSLRECIISESQIFNQQGLGIGDALIQIMTEQGLANIGYTDALGEITFFTEKTQAIWLSCLVEASLIELKTKEKKSYNSIAAFLKICRLIFKGRYA